MSDRLETSSTNTYRTVLYDKYVSAFKSENASLSESELSHYFEWCDARYYPHLESVPKSAAILELGCGHGRMLAYLRQKGFTNVSGIDLSEEQIALARKNNLDAETADVFEFLNKTSAALSRRGSIAHDAGNGYDCIIAIDFVEHFTREELFRLFEGMHGAMNPNGMILVQTVNGEGLFPHQIAHGDLTHETILSPGSMSQLLRAIGFRNPAFFECAPLVKGLSGILRTIAWRAIRFSANLIRKIEAGKTQSVWTENFITVAKK
ncbi:MAG TPA: class I SAM-dependent methyltransferase [Candidatus Kapabacteria bacterium]|jgi:cyclopropane fatty-acyl-phospholipid synthase-like methyltransferase